MDSINGISYYLSKCQTLSNTSQITFFLSGRQRIGALHMHCACNTVQLLRLSRLPFSWTMPATSPSWMHWLQDLGVIEQHEYESRVKKTEEIKERLVELWQCTVTFEWKNAIFVFPVLPGIAEAHVISIGIVKWFLIPYFMGNISAKKYQNVFAYVQVIAKQRWDVFLRQYIVAKRLDGWRRHLLRR